MRSRMNQQSSPVGVHDIHVDAFKAVMRNVAGAVSVITATHERHRGGLTATSLTALSADPPTVLVCINRNASAWPTIEAAGHFAINVLAARHQSIADRFAGRGGFKGEARFEEGQWARMATGAPTLDGALAVLDCETEEAIERHSHTILIGRIKAIRHAQDEGALLYWRGVYGKLDESLQYGAGI
ncbi:NADH-FMN oxidoreductase RutF, flavin reductase (DIM6/NTAB) family [Bosea lathyri]|uniref:NADH-FMN oxidoreductase RutF, flavin reductase (DIM6/NTAB) family n=2 Tax=Bosea lathyri TaxID=1036778 RepID=A0A1H6D973_9HYPH|nr:NADH-FMN oxidoreductase RutF, flavin reductase (DIM6/NTAB) family [Bosea lathyri]